MPATPSPLWFLDRSAGEVTLLLLSAGMAVGIVRAAVPSAYPFLIEGIHRNLALLAVGFAGLHVVAAILDPYAALGPMDALVPFVSVYRGTWLGLGVVSGYLYLAVLLSSWPVRRFPRATWVWVHRTMYVAWVAALVHSLGTGSDARNELFLLLNLIAVTAVLVAFLAFRVGEGWRRLPPLWAALAVVAVVTVIGVGIWAAGGPLRAGWARSSGTPPGLLQTP
jgi:sulfoxide reductase heme-binding subunit YedZ